ncbi:hypothetical protein [Arsenophonus endosymbiont of Aphis craccivora]|uniref:hypothetical protein n=1 Tax=Arsenophonus endosymbiont of Aphis craccivora TaxID=1231049 RepID=UPI0015DF4D83|nr:hypothetical protein [Arsenophonus endosymbiont of Aphis craccivora]
MTWGPDVETNLAISSANHLKVRFIQQSPILLKPADLSQQKIDITPILKIAQNLCKN